MIFVVNTYQPEYNLCVLRTTRFQTIFTNSFRDLHPRNLTNWYQTWPIFKGPKLPFPRQPSFRGPPAVSWLGGGSQPKHVLRPSNLAALRGKQNGKRPVDGDCILTVTAWCEICQLFCYWNSQDIYLKVKIDGTNTKRWVNKGSL